MRKKEIGQVFILVLIVLAIGAMLVVPALRLTGTSLTNSRVVERQTKGLYAADAAQEYILWKLLYDIDWRTGTFADNNDSDQFSFYVCDIPIDVTVVMRATEGEGGTTLATDDKIQPTKTVDTGFDPNYWVPNKDLYTYTYTIKLDHISDNTSVVLDAIYDIPPGEISEYIGPTELRVDGGEWRTVPDPYYEELGSKGYIKWPADYEWDPVVTGTFSSHPEFLGIEDFEVRQVKELRFRMRGRLADNQVHCNWVVLKMADGTNTLSGPQAPIKVGGNPEIPGECSGEGGIAATKISDPEIIQPGMVQDIIYTIYVTNMSGDTEEIQELTDYLPPGFFYIPGSVSDTSTITTDEPLDVALEDVNGVERQRVRWTEAQFQGIGQIQADETKTLTFLATTTKEVSGSYYNEVIVIVKKTATPGSAFAIAGVSPSEYGSGYSWLAGAVIVPAYDSSSEAEGVTINANMSLILGGITITSWQLD